MSECDHVLNPTRLLTFSPALAQPWSTMGLEEQGQVWFGIHVFITSAFCLCGDTYVAISAISCDRDRAEYARQPRQ